MHWPQPGSHPSNRRICGGWPSAPYRHARETRPPWWGAPGVELDVGNGGVLFRAGPVPQAQRPQGHVIAGQSFTSCALSLQHQRQWRRSARISLGNLEASTATRRNSPPWCAVLGRSSLVSRCMAQLVRTLNLTQGRPFAPPGLFPSDGLAASVRLPGGAPLGTFGGFLRTVFPRRSAVANR